MLKRPLPAVPGVAGKLQLREKKEMEKEKKELVANEKNKKRLSLSHFGG